ncbi:MAG: hypothetical protein P4L84_00895 [Isosphaeraceae bacterium]|nr:hypothetical protein [Isosphaeraceae bacterium]
MTRPADEALSAALDAAEEAYHRARIRGDIDPVVAVTRSDRENPDRIEVTVCSRAALIASLPQECREIAQSLQDGVDSEGLLTIVVRTWNGVSIIDRYTPHGSSSSSN